MSKLIPMEEAANILRMTVEQLSELRSNHEIFGYRDGQNWKFKMTELERVAGDLDIKLNLSNVAQVADDLSESFGFDLSDSGDDLVMDDDSSSGGMIEELDSAEFAEDSSVELFQNPIKDGLSIASDDDSIQLDDDLDAISLADSGLLKKGTSKHLDAPHDSGALKLEDSAEILASDDNVFDDDEELSFGSSSLSLASESSKKLAAAAAGTGSDLLDDEVEKTGSPSDTGKMLGANDDDDLLLSNDDDLFSDELSLADSASFEDSAELSSDFESSELVLDDSDSSSEIMLEANKSGINLSANESGISLADEPLELGGSDIDALELPEDDDDMIVLEDAADPEAATMMQEDDFNLTPLEASMEEDESSGSQVIALEDSEIYADESSATILGESDSFEAQPVLNDSMGLDAGGGMMPYEDPALAGGAMMAPAGTAMGPAALPEAPYTIFQVLSLGFVATLLALGGMVAYNLAQNMWLPEEQILGKSVLNFFLELTGMNG